MHTHLPDRSPGTLACGETWSRVATFVSAVDANLDRWLTDTHRVGLSDYRALAAISRAPDKELRIAVLAERIRLTSTSTTRLVSRLETKGLVRRDVCGDDARGVYAVIEKAGEELLTQARPAYEERLTDLLSNPAQHFPHLDPAATASALKEVSELTAH
ncbi:MarR family winged helix-turn-helix transcriptional regulator [Enemella sp. A6]|uniref:MarR family winged helix-turn-helix transcriptional regulator n=1 Tax=Enemella sp. A6 TaxID=3440152 RepID=UPI003EB904A0